MALAVAAVFVVWACYALSGAGAIRRLPLLRVALFAIAAVYLLRGVQVAPEVMGVARGAVPWRFAVFSAFSAFAGVVYLLGVIGVGRSGGAPQAHAS
jgi:hypothetical protein